MRESSTTLLVVVLIAVLFIAPTLLGTFFTGIRDFFGDFRDMWLKDWGDGDLITDNSNIDTSLRITIVYTDGQRDTVELPTHSIFPLTIFTTDGKELSHLTITTLLTMTYSGTLTSWKIDMTYTNKIDDSMVENFPIIREGSSWTDGEQKIIHEANWSADYMETFLISKGWTSGEFRFYSDITLNVSVDFESGVTDTGSDSITGSMRFIYDADGITSLSVSITPSLTTNS